MRIIYFICLCLISTISRAQDLNPETVELKSSLNLNEGWTRNLNLNLGVNAASQKDVVGSQDGNTTTWASKIEGKATLISGSNEWRNELLAALTMSRTPVLPNYFKSDDMLRFTSLYLWHVKGWEQVGPFARFEGNTEMMNSYDVRSEQVTYSIAAENEGGAPELRTDDRLKLTDAFTPMILKETTGAFYNPYKSDLVSIELLLGIGARQTLAEGQLVLSDNGDTAEIEVSRLNDQKEVGSEGKVSVLGQLTARVSYKIESELFVPFSRSDESQLDKDKDAFEKRSWETMANLSFKLVEWASLEYLHRLERNYSLSPKVQRTNTLLFNLSYLIGDKFTEEKKI